jgi:hypothetical protein
MEILVSQLDMESLKRVASTCKELRDAFSLEDAGSFLNWAKRVTMARIQGRSVISGSHVSNKRSRDSQDDERGWSGSTTGREAHREYTLRTIV